MENLKNDRRRVARFLKTYFLNQIFTIRLKPELGGLAVELSKTELRLEKVWYNHLYFTLAGTGGSTIFKIPLKLIECLVSHPEKRTGYEYSVVILRDSECSNNFLKCEFFNPLQESASEGQSEVSLEVSPVHL